MFTQLFRYIDHIHPPLSSPFILNLPLVTNPPTRPDLHSCPSILTICSLLGVGGHTMVFHPWIYCALLELTPSITLPYPFPHPLLFKSFQCVSCAIFHTDAMYFDIIHHHSLFLSSSPYSPQTVPLLQTRSLSICMYVQVCICVYVYPLDLLKID
jgi:hypothetical protein